MNYALNNQNQNKLSLRIVLFLAIIAFFGSIPLFELSAAVWKNSSSTIETKSSDKTLNISEVIQTFDVVMET